MNSFQPNITPDPLPTFEISAFLLGILVGETTIRRNPMKSNVVILALAGV